MRLPWFLEERFFCFLFFISGIVTTHVAPLDCELNVSYKPYFPLVSWPKICYITIGARFATHAFSWVLRAYLILRDLSWSPLTICTNKSLQFFWFISRFLFQMLIWVPFFVLERNYSRSCNLYALQLASNGLFTFSSVFHLKYKKIKQV